MRRGEQSPDELSRPDGNGLADNYEKHDIGQAELLRRLDESAIDAEVEEWGIDLRDDDGDRIIYDDKMDFRLVDDGDVVAHIDVKTKSSPSYMGRFNARHYDHYYHHATEKDVPTFVVMFQVDYETETIDDEFVFRLGDAERDVRIERSSKSTAVDDFPDGNEAVLVPHEHRQPWHTLVWQVLLEQGALSPTTVERGAEADDPDVTGKTEDEEP